MAAVAAAAAGMSAFERIVPALIERARQLAATHQARSADNTRNWRSARWLWPSLFKASLFKD